MVASCSAFGCVRRHSKKDKTSFHRFPLDKPELLMQWKIAIRRSNWEPTIDSRICGAHFKKEDYATRKGPNSRAKLKPDAVPSIFNFPTKDSHICDADFKDEDLITKKGPNSRAKLKHDAVPSIFNFPTQFKKAKSPHTERKLENPIIVVLQSYPTTVSPSKEDKMNAL